MVVIDEADIQKRIRIHDLFRTSSCLTKLGDNRYKDKTTNLYCWRGVIKSTKGEGGEEDSCIVGAVCDPHSYTYARTRFCLAFPSKDCIPHRFVADPTGVNIPTNNRRGGIIVGNFPEECQQAIGAIGCIGDGVTQSFDHAARDGPKMFVNLIAFAIGMGVVAYMATKTGTAGKIGKIASKKIKYQ